MRILSLILLISLQIFNCNGVQLVECGVGLIIPGPVCDWGFNGQYTTFGAFNMTSHMDISFNVSLKRGEWGSTELFRFENTAGRVPLKLISGASGGPHTRVILNDATGTETTIQCDDYGGGAYKIQIDARTITLSQNGAICDQVTLSNDLLESNLINTAFTVYGGSFSAGPCTHIVINAMCPRTTAPTTDPTSDPTNDPTNDPTSDPTTDPTTDPTSEPTNDPTNDPTSDPTTDPTTDPTMDPTTDPTANPTYIPTSVPTYNPTLPVPCKPGEFIYAGYSSCFQCGMHTDGYQCKGYSIVEVQMGYWITAKFKHSLLSLHEIGNISNFTIDSARCPPGQCCSKSEGCDYRKDAQSICAHGRDTASVTCSKCKEDLYELTGSSQCGLCSTINYAYIGILFLLTLIFVILMIFICSKPSHLYLDDMMKQNEFDWKILLVRDDAEAVKVVVLKIAIYFYQALSQIMLMKNITPSTQFESILLTISNFEILTVSRNSGFCFIGNITSGLYELFINYIFYVFTGVNFIFFVLLTWYNKNITLYQFVCCFCCCKSWLSHKPYIKTAIINVLIMTAGPILATSFKMLTCIEGVDRDEYVHFYDATITCFNWVWFYGLITIIIVCMFFITLWYLIKKQGVHHRENTSNKYRSLTNKYTSKVWWWECVIFFRRFTIALLTSFHYMADHITIIVLITVLIILFGMQIRFNPFKYQRANYMEIICLMSLISIIICSNFVDPNYVDQAFVNKLISWYISLLILFPFLVILLMILSSIYKWYKLSNKYIAFDEYIYNFKNIKKRMPSVYKDWLYNQVEMQSLSVRTPINDGFDDGQENIDLVSIDNDQIRRKKFSKQEFMDDLSISKFVDDLSVEDEESINHFSDDNEPLIKHESVDVDGLDKEKN